MKKSKVTRSLLAACSIVALTAVMYGCSSNGPSQADLDAAEAAAAAAEAAAAAAAEAKAAAEQQAAALQTQINGLRMRLGLEADDDLGDDIADLQAEVERLQAALQARIDAANAAAAQVASDDAKHLLAALAVTDFTDVNTTDDGTQITVGGEEVTVPDDLTVTLKVSNDGMLTAEATDHTMSAMAPDMIEDWRGAMLVGNVGTAVAGDTAVVYSDIGNDGTVSLLDRYASELPTTTLPRRWVIDNDDTDDGGTSGSADDMDISWSSVMRPDDATLVMGGTAELPTLTFQGTVHGIPGTFTCTNITGTVCAAPVRYSDGTVHTGAAAGTNTPAVGTWDFRPDAGANLYTDDEDYLTFGWWLDKGPDGKADYVRLITAAQGLGDMRENADTAAGTQGSAIRGSATYTGAAAGKYAIASLTADTYEGGHFTAAATLMVNFDADLTPATAANDRDGIALSGTIDNFMTGDVERPNWSVALMADNAAAAGVQPLTHLVDADTPTAGRSMKTEWSIGAAQMGTGEWTADWYGSEMGTSHPNAVTGTFNANIGTTTGDAGAVGRIQGAFGANKTDD